MTFLGKSTALPALGGWRIEPRRAARKRCRCYARVRSESPHPRRLGKDTNRLVHAYFDVDPQVLWDTIQNDLPPLTVPMLQLLPFTSKEAGQDSNEISV